MATGPRKKMACRPTHFRSGKKMGRPSKYSDDLCDQVIALGKEGKSKAQIACELGLRITTVESWADPNNSAYQPKFSDAWRQAQVEAQAHFESLAKDLIVDVRKKGGEGRYTNTALLTFLFKNRFRKDYGDQSNTEVNANGNTTININYDVATPPINPE